MSGWERARETELGWNVRPLLCVCVCVCTRSHCVLVRTCVLVVAARKLISARVYLWLGAGRAICASARALEYMCALSVTVCVCVCSARARQRLATGVRCLVRAAAVPSLTSSGLMTPTRRLQVHSHTQHAHSRTHTHTQPD